MTAQETEAAAPLAVLVLFHERPLQTVECLASFVPSGVPVYVLNNGSSPAATRTVADFAAAHPRITVWDSSRNLGVAAGRNALIGRTREEWLFFMDNDAYMATKDWRPRIAEHIAADPNVEALVPRIVNVHAGSSAEKWGDVVIEDGELRQVQRPGRIETNIFGGTAVVKRSFFQRIGAYDEAMFVGYEDLEIAVRALLAGAPVRARHIDDVELVHEHRRAETPADRRAALERYSSETVKRSFSHLLKKHGLRWNIPGTGWADRERRRMAGGPIVRWFAALQSYLLERSARR